MPACSSSVDRFSESSSPDCPNQRFSDIKEQTVQFDAKLNENFKLKNLSKQAQDLERTKTAEKLDRSTIKLFLLFYTWIFLGQYFISPNLQKYYTLQYRYEGTNAYDIGWDDIYFVFFWIVNLLFLRSFMIIYVFRPCARLLGITKFKATQRFIEQGWSILYYSFSWGFGFYLYYTSDYFFDCYNIYANWPHDHLSKAFKFYYLVQTASWFQQFIVLHLEERRKDHYQMFAHHIITCLLCTGSYAYYFTRIGHIFLLQMDIVDIFLSSAKILKYSGFQTICDVMFIIFMLSWIVLRHIVYNYVLWFSWAKARLIMNADCARYLPGEVVKICYTDFTIDCLLILLAFLQIIMCLWMYMILRVAYRVISGESADDVRSDSD